MFAFDVSANVAGVVRTTLVYWLGLMAISWTCTAAPTRRSVYRGRNVVPLLTTTCPVTDGNPVAAAVMMSLPSDNPVMSNAAWYAPVGIVTVAGTPIEVVVCDKVIASGDVTGV